MSKFIKVFNKRWGFLSKELKTMSSLRRTYSDSILDLKLLQIKAPSRRRKKKISECITRRLSSSSPSIDTSMKVSSESIKQWKKNMQRQEKAAKKTKKLFPNYFVSLRIISDEIITRARELQAEMIVEQPNMKKMNVPVETMHLTLLVCKLEADDVKRASSVLSAVAKKLFLDSELFHFGVTGTGTFGRRVFFAEIAEGKDSIIELGKELRKQFKENNLLITDNRELSPHITLAKSIRSRERISDQCMDKFVNSYIHFGTQPARTIELCQMKRADDGYYIVDEEIDLKSGISVIGTSKGDNVETAADGDHKDN